MKVKLPDGYKRGVDQLILHVPAHQLTIEGGYGHVRVDFGVARASDGTVRAPMYWPLGECRLTCQIGTWRSSSMDELDLNPYAWRMEYRGPVDLGSVAQVAKLLTGINRELERMDDTEGRPESFGAWCNRVARAVGADAIWCQSTEDPREHTKWKIGEIAWVINDRARKVGEEVARRSGSKAGAA